MLHKLSLSLQLLGIKHSFSKDIYCLHSTKGSSSSSLPILYQIQRISREVLLAKTSLAASLRLLFINPKNSASDLSLRAQEGSSRISGFPSGFLIILLRGLSRNPGFPDKRYQFDHSQGMKNGQSSIPEQKDPSTEPNQGFGLFPLLFWGQGSVPVSKKHLEIQSHDSMENREW